MNRAEISSNGAGAHANSVPVPFKEYAAKRKLSVSEGSPDSDRVVQRRKDDGGTHAVSSDVTSANEANVSVPAEIVATNDVLKESTNSSDRPQNHKGSPIDQYEEDALSKINWSEGRRSTSDGLPTCLYDKRRNRGEKILKKSVRFVSEAKLVRARLFEMDDEERANVFRLKQEALEKGTLDYHQKEKLEERKMLENAQNMQRSSLPDESPWTTPPLISNLPPSLMDRGRESTEKIVLFARQSSAMTGLNVDRDYLPDTPDEPLEPPKVQSSDMVFVPLSRPEMADIFRKPISKLEPSGPLPEEPVLLPVTAPPMPPVQNSHPPPFITSYDHLRHSLDSSLFAPRQPVAFPHLSSPNGPPRYPDQYSFPSRGPPPIESRFPSSLSPSRMQVRPGPRSPTEPRYHQPGGSFAPRQRFNSNDNKDSHRGTGRGGAHTVERTPAGQIICHFFRSPSGCNNGSKCKFAHIPK